MSKHCLPWITYKIRELIRAKHRLHAKLKYNSSPNILGKYKQARHTLQIEIRKSYLSYIENIIDYTVDTHNRHTKHNKFWSFIKSSRHGAPGVSPLRSQGVTYNDSTVKAKILNNQLSSVFTHEKPGPLPDKGPSPYPNMPHISISTVGM